MTVGIAFTNGLEAIVITDSRASGCNREGDSVNKIGIFCSEKYAGVVFGAGSRNLVEGVIRNLEDVSADNLDKFVEKVYDSYKDRLDGYEVINLASLRSEIKKKGQLIEKEEEREQFIKQKIYDLMQEYDKYKQAKENRTDFVLLGYDKVKEKIRLFILEPLARGELGTDHTEIGSGAEGANIYLSTKLQGVDSTKLRLADLAFFALNAFSMSTIYQGVGGTPKIAKISKNGCEIIPDEKTIVLANLSCAYLSEFSTSVLNHESTRTRFEEILNCNNMNYDAIAKEVGLNEDTLRTTYIPYSSWQERANRGLFSLQNQQ